MTGGYLVRRVGQFLIVLWGAATLNFILPRLAPGDPVRNRLLSLAAQGGVQQEGINQMVKSYDAQYGLDQPIWHQYLIYLWNALHLNFGYSISNYPTHVSTLIFGALPWTIGLLATATIIAFAMGTLLGALIAWPASPRELNYLVVPLMGLSAIPYYLLGLILIFLFTIVMQLFPSSGGYTAGAIPNLSAGFSLDVLKHSLLPGFSIALASTGLWALSMRGMMVTTSGEDYVEFAEAKGLKKARVFFTYGLRNAILPQTTSFALSLGTIVSGSVIVEVVFGYPGVGSLLFSAIQSQDYFLIYGIVLIIVVAIALATLIVDLVYPLLDPRIAYKRQ